MLRAITRQNIFDRLGESYFGADNYLVSFGRDDKESILKIVFLPEPNFFYEITTYNNGFFRLEEAPSVSLLTSQSSLISNISDIVGRLDGWMDRIKQEMIISNPFARELADLKKQIDQKLASLSGQISDYFTKIEADEIKVKLDAFEQRLKQAGEENEELKKSLDELAKIVNDLKEAADSVNKGTWFRMAGGRLLSGLKSIVKAKETREFALEAAKKIFLEGPK